MIVKRRGGMTNSSRLHRKNGKTGRDHSFNLIENLHHRLSRLEGELGLPLNEAEACTAFLEKIKRDESQIEELHTSLITGGASDC